MRVKSGETFVVSGLDKSSNGENKEKKMDSRTIWEASSFIVLSNWLEVWGEEEERIKAAQVSVMSHRVAGSTVLGQWMWEKEQVWDRKINVRVELDCEDLGGVFQ